MNVFLDIPEDLKLKFRQDIDSSAVECFLDLARQDCQRKQAQAKLENLLQVGVDSEVESVTADY
ncbi:type II toxin-antitoxin system ParD family antitoxin [Lusitaniella coriacea LEGE 07157]|uniref:Type II toxin-antitoxin system ParD family antitoxin n=1 Tax=Lusitaniella coriacea LEGE 07157 TaxID=945747 RepID=A0A8J7JB52_9CYAN|nr:type II toxin-antitoxin system ParD family antitoxin [Lusitaniella coriacea]MBE9116670.1 type II toxin-antitoxin system ParD family antitoxin [Lusitaniella coriacea LEGE 07157]